VVRDDSFGTAIFSKLPIQDEAIWTIDELPQTKVRIRLGAGLLEIWNIHVLPPTSWDYARAHAMELDFLAEAMELTTF
jgi:hypothetical protein